MSELVRAFLGIEINDQPLLSRVSQIQQKLDSQAAKMKLVEINNIHFTLRFFGDTPILRVNQIKAQLEQMSIDPFEITIEGVGTFPNIRRPRVVWIGVTHNEHQVQDLKEKIDSLLEDVGYQPERKKYTPHATIARVRYVKDMRKMASCLEMIADELVGSMTVAKIKMMKSTLTPQGPIYDTLWEL
ncbi:MAG: RNA 2',3'-cyclic phosphodiesterase [Promethearchaeota archaeon]